MNFDRLNKRVFVFFFCSFSISAFADSPRFTYIEAEYVASGDLDMTNGVISASADLDGVAITGSLELGILILQASRFKLDGDATLNTELEDSTATIVLGLSVELANTQRYDLVRAHQNELVASSLF